MLSLPHQEGFWEYLHSHKPPGWGEGLSDDRIYFAPDEHGIMQRVEESQLEEYWEEHPEGEDYWKEYDGEENEEPILWLPH